MAAVREYGTPLVDDPDRLAGVQALGVDETAFLAATADRRHRVRHRHRRPDPTAGRRLLDVVAGPQRNRLVRLDFAAATQAWRDGISVAALDPFRGYATALRTALPHATRVLDAFHVIRLGFAAVDEVRRRVQQETLGHRGRQDDPLYRIRRLLRRGHEHHTDTVLGPAADRARRRRPSTSRSPRPGSPPRTCGCSTAPRPGTGAERRLLPVAGPLRRLRASPNCTGSPAPSTPGATELLAYFDTGGVSNGPTEAMNLLIKKIKRVGHGFRNFDNYRLRLLLHCGVDWHTPPPPRSEAGYHAWLRRAAKPQLVSDNLSAHRSRPMRAWILVGYPGQGGASAPHRVSPWSSRTPFTYTERGVNPRNWSAWSDSSARSVG